MFGYMENLYTVERQVELAVAGGTQRFELRQAKLSGRPARLPYIAIVDTNDAGKVTLDTLLLYEDLAALEADWTRLVSAEKVDVNNLGYVERIEDHVTGYRKDGGIAMY